MYQPGYYPIMKLLLPPLGRMIFLIPLSPCVCPKIRCSRKNKHKKKKRDYDILRFYRVSDITRKLEGK